MFCSRRIFLPFLFLIIFISSCDIEKNWYYNIQNNSSDTLWIYTTNIIKSDSISIAPNEIELLNTDSECCGGHKIYENIENNNLEEVLISNLDTTIEIMDLEWEWEYVKTGKYTAEYNLILTDERFN